MAQVSDRSNAHLLCTLWEHTSHPAERKTCRISPGRSLWPCGLRRGSAGAYMPELRVRIPPGAWMSVSFECCVLSGREVSVMGRSLLQRSPTEFDVCL